MGESVSTFGIAMQVAERAEHGPEDFQTRRAGFAGSDRTIFTSGRSRRKTRPTPDCRLSRNRLRSNRASGPRSRRGSPDRRALVHVGVRLGVLDIDAPGDRAVQTTSNARCAPPPRAQGLDAAGLSMKSSGLVSLRSSGGNSVGGYPNFIACSTASSSGDIA